MPIPHTYRVIGKIGAGNSGEIYKAYQINLGKYVVLKKIKTEIKDFLNNRAEVDVLKTSDIPVCLRFLTFLRRTGMCIQLWILSRGIHLRIIWIPELFLKRNQSLSGQSR